MKESPLVSIISVNYNQSAVTLEMLESLKNISYPNYEIIVVDNGSPSDTPELIKEKYPYVNLIISKKNLGFAGGNNIGVKEAKGKYIFFLNNDTEVEPNFMEPLVEKMESDNKIAMASPKIVFFHSENKNLLQYAGAVAINPFTGRGRNIGYKEIDTGKYETTKETDLGHGAALMVRMETMLEMGLMPDIYFLYYEEHDWCAMFRRAGYKAFYVANSKIYHKESISIGKNSPLKAYHMGRNRIIYLRRNTKFLTFIISILFYTFLSTPKSILQFLIKGEFDLLKAFNKGVFWNFFHYKGIHKNPKLKRTSDGKYELFDTFY